MEFELDAPLGCGLKHPDDIANHDVLLDGPCVISIVGAINKKMQLGQRESVGILETSNQIQGKILGLKSISRAVHSQVNEKPLSALILQVVL